MGVVARRVPATPVHTSTSTWDRISDLLAPNSSPERQQLHSVRDIAGILIAEEYTATAPIIVSPAAGDQIRIYTLHGADALGEEITESPLATWPLAEPGWAISLPCGAIDLPNLGPRLLDHTGFTLRDVSTGTQLTNSTNASPPGTSRTQSSSSARTGSQEPIRVNFDEMRRP